MKIDTLITKLQDIRNRFGNVEVMIGIDAVSKPEYLYGNFSVGVCKDGDSETECFCQLWSGELFDYEKVNKNE